MNLKLLQYIKIPSLNANSSKVGYVQVSIGDKMKMWFVVLKGKYGLYCKPPAIRPQEEFLQAFEWINPDTLKVISKEIIQELDQSPDITS